MNLLEKTGRRKRLNIFLACSIVMGIAMIWFLQSGKYLSEGLIALVIEIIIFFVGINLINCPKCKKSWMFYFMNNKDSSSWLVELLRLNKCPCCEYSES